jgi:hypothetical protein
VDFVNAATLDDLKARAKIKLLEKIIRSDVTIPDWYWNGANMHGFGEPPEKGHFTNSNPYTGYNPDADGRTYVKLTGKMAVAKLPEAEWLGMPPAAAHFSPVSIEAEPALNVAWYEGGFLHTHIQEAHGDKVEPTPHAMFGEGVNAPVGGHKIDIEFQWDRSQTSMHTDLSFVPVGMCMLPPNVETKGEPAT